MLPLVCREFVSLLKPGGDLTNATNDYSNYGFLYGTFPTAPSVFVFATHYNVQPDLMASSMVAVTFLSAPLMLVSAKMVALVHIDPLYYVKELESFLMQVSSIGFIASVWVVVVFLLSRKWRQVPHFITLCLAISQSLASLGALLWSVLDCTQTWQLYLQFSLVTFGVFSSRFFTAILAVTLFLLRWRSLSFVLNMRPLLAALGWGIPGVLVLVLVMVVQREMDLVDKLDLNFQYGTTQAVVALLLLWFTLFTTIVCLILQQRQQKRYEAYSSMTDAHSPDDIAPLTTHNRNEDGFGPTLSDCSDIDAMSTDSDDLFSPNAELRPSSRNAKKHQLSCSINNCPVAPVNSISASYNSPSTVVWDRNSPSRAASEPGDIKPSTSETENQNQTSEVDGRAATVVDMEGPCGSTYNAAPGPRDICDNPANEASYRQYSAAANRLRLPQESRPIVRDRDDEFQMMRHVVLLLFLCGSMIVGLGLCLWTLVSEDISGIL